MQEDVDGPVAFGGVLVGSGYVFEKTVSESDVYGFAGITGDFSPNHVNERYMQGSKFGTRIVHGALTVGFTSTAAAGFCEKFSVHGVVLGYDKIRFIAPVFIGDTIRVSYQVASIDMGRSRIYADINVVNQDGQQVLVCTHIIRTMRLRE